MLTEPVTVHGTGIPWQKRYRAAIAEGLRSRGIEVRESGTNDLHAGTHVLLGPNSFRHLAGRLTETGEDFVTVNRAFIGSVLGNESNPYVAIGWNGYNNNTRFPFSYADAVDGLLPHSRMTPDLWRYVEPARTPDGPALILGEYDEFPKFYRQAVADCERNSRQWWFRPHPDGRVPASARACPAKNLRRACHDSSIILTHHSTAACEALLRGVPVVVYDEESMCWPIGQPAPVDGFDFALPDRGPWTQWLAWTQWTITEIAAGEPWEWF